MAISPPHERAFGWDLSGRVAAVAGAARGISRETAELLRGRGDGLALSGVGPARPPGQPGEIAEVVALLAPPAAGFVTGALVTADGGHAAI